MVSYEMSSDLVLRMVCGLDVCRCLEIPGPRCYTTSHELPTTYMPF